MDETDKSDPYGPNDLQADLHQQLREVIDRSKAPTTDIEWTPEEQAELQAELARNTFNPEYANPDNPDRKIKIDGEQVDGYWYNNFPVILSVMDRLNNSQDPISLDSFEQMYATVAESRRYPELFAMLQHSSPALYKRALQLFRSKDAPTDHRGRELSENEVIFIHSQAYSAAAALARRLDPNYDLDYLRK